MMDPPTSRAAKLRAALKLYRHQCISAHFIQLVLQSPALSGFTLRQKLIICMDKRSLETKQVTSLLL